MAIEFRTRSKAIQPDSEDRGACCTVAGSEYVCDDNGGGGVRYIDCKRNLGIFRGKDSTCDDQGCPSGTPGNPEIPLTSDLHGACKTCSSCTDNILIENCITQTNFDAEFFSSKLCSEVSEEKLSAIQDQKYACCIGDGSCFDTCNSDYCTNLGGIFHDGVQTGLAVQCASNPCNNTNNIVSVGACCRAGQCIGQLTQFDCVANNGTWIGEGTDCSVNGNYDCKTATFTSDRTRSRTSEQQSREPNGLNGASVVCSRPTTRKYYYKDGDNHGRWRGEVGPTYSNEPVWVTLHITEADCEGVGGIVGATDGDINKAIMWGGCQFEPEEGQGYVCQSKTLQQCSELQGKWWPGQYCDDIRSLPASGLLFANKVLTGLEEKFLAGSCHIVDGVQSSYDNVTPTVTCGDMQTEYQCAKALQQKRDYYMQVISAGQNTNWGESDLDRKLEAIWRPGKTCTQPECTTNETLILADNTLGLCRIDSQKSASYWTGTTGGSISVNEYTYHTGRQTVCMDNFTKTDCEILHGDWQPVCQTCEELGLTTPVATGSCCTDPDTCEDGKTYLECQSVSGFFHGPGTSCADRDCGKVAFLEPIDGEENINANCKCVVAEEPSTTALRVFARQDAQGGADVWAGSTCGDPTVDAMPYYDNTNFSKDTFVLYTDPPEIGGSGTGEIYTDSRPIGDLKYNFYDEPFRTFIVSDHTDGSGTFLDDILIQGVDAEFNNGQQCFFRVDKKEPFTIPFAPETLKSIKGVTLEINQPADSIHRLIMNEPELYWTGGNGYLPRSRKIKYVNFGGMTQLRQLGLQGFVYDNLRSDFESQTFDFLSALDLRGSTLDGLDVSNCEALERVTLNHNAITTLDFTGNEFVTSVDVAYNNLTSLTLKDDSIYLADLRVGYNESLSSIGGSYPQLETFYAQRCNFSVLDFSNMPFLLDVQLQKNPLTNLNLDKCPSIDYINLDSCITNSTDISGDRFILPSSTNRVLLQNDLPVSIRDNIDIPSPSTALNRFSFKNNTVRESGYGPFSIKLAETIAITRFSDLNNTRFAASQDLEPRGKDNPVYCETIDLSNVEDSTLTSGSAKKMLEYIFGGITDINVIKHNKKIRIILTGINTDVDYTNLNVSSAVLNRMSFIN